MQIGFIGLGRMGGNMAKKLLLDGHKVVVWNRTSATAEELKTQSSKLKIKTQNLKIAKSVQELVESLEKPRVVWSMLPAGEATEEMLKEIAQYIEKNDIVIDGGNAHYKDTERRYKKLKTKNIRFLGIGVSGGVIAAVDGYPIMVGGDKSAYKHITPLLDSLGKPKGGHEYFGTGGAGHFVKMLHNGIEYGIMQSLGEGFDVLHNAPYKFDLLKVGKLWQKGTLVSGFMLDRAVETITADPDLSKITGFIAESGEARWTIDQGKEEGIPVEIIERSLDYRKRSQTDKKIQASFTARMVAALRFAFGRHPVQKAEIKKIKKKS